MTVPEASGHDAVGAADQRRAQMVRAALEVISERGYAETRVADVAERAGVSPALVIYYFKTKDQLLTEAIRHYEDTWYAVGQARIERLPTAAARLEELVAMICLAEEDPEIGGSWQLWLDFWTQAARNHAVARERQHSDKRWRELIASVVRAGQAAGEFRAIGADSFAVYLSALLDGMTVRIALADPVVDSARAFELTMLFVAGELGFPWTGARGGG